MHHYCDLPRASSASTARKKLRASIKACKDWLKAHRHLPLALLLVKLARKVRLRMVSAVGAWTRGSLSKFYTRVVVANAASKLLADPTRD
jgi:hypothetical protein